MTTMPPNATNMADEHRSGRRNIRATLKAALARAHALQGPYNAFATLADDGALARADELARNVEAGKDPGPLAGVPVSVKDILNVAGLPTRWGSPLMADASAAKADVAAVARLRAAGAVVIGKTTTTEFAHSLLGASPLTGLTRNPWAPALTCGGSSAGAGVSVATEIAPLALATDAGCSTRLPAACTGVYGLKPTLGAAPHDRVPEAFANFIHLGLLAGSVRDLARGLDVIAGPYAGDPYSLTRPLPNAAAGLDQPVLKGARVLLWLTTGNRRVAAEIVQATRAAATSLTRLGASVTEEPVRSTIRSGLADPAAVELRRALCVPQGGRPRQTFVNAQRRHRCRIVLPRPRLQRALIKRSELFRAVQGVFGEGIDFILTPCVSAPPVAAEYDPAQPLVIDGVEAGDLRSEWTPYLSLFDLTGHPAIAMPVGFSESGAPLGVQLVAPWAKDAALLAAAHAYQRAAPAQRELRLPA